MGSRRKGTVVCAAIAAMLIAAPSAQASFHLMSIREVYPGSSAAPDSGYVELQMYAAGQMLVGGHAVTIYDSGGTTIGSFAFGADVANGASQQTILVGDSGVEAAFGVEPDLVAAGLEIRRAGGAACWAGSIDCVSWGSFGGATPSPSGAPADAGGIPDGMALWRTIEPGCPTLLEAGDDRNDSSLDFFDAAPAPRPNSVAASEHACAAVGGGGGGSGEAGRGGSEAGGNGGRGGGNPPQTSIRRGPPRVSRLRTATFRFASSQPGATFLCSLDGRAFAACRSPHAVRHLRPGRHVFRVEARAPGGLTDRSPAAWAFRVLEKAR
jgi:hypothetical protein